MDRHCEICEMPLGPRTFLRRGYPTKVFCSIRCVDAFEARGGLPSGRVDETRPGWSRFPAVATERPPLPC